MTPRIAAASGSTSNIFASLNQPYKLSTLLAMLLILAQRAQSQVNNTNITNITTTTQPPSHTDTLTIIAVVVGYGSLIALAIVGPIFVYCVANQDAHQPSFFYYNSYPQQANQPQNNHALVEHAAPGDIEHMPMAEAADNAEPVSYEAEENTELTATDSELIRTPSLEEQDIENNKSPKP